MLFYGGVVFKIQYQKQNQKREIHKATFPKIKSFCLSKWESDRAGEGLGGQGLLCSRDDQSLDPTTHVGKTKKPGSVV